MRNSVAWIVAVILSLAAHVGLLSAANHIKLTSQTNKSPPEITLGAGTFQTVAVPASGTEAIAANEAAQAAETLATATSLEAQAPTGGGAELAPAPELQSQQGGDSVAAGGAAEAPAAAEQQAAAPDSAAADVIQDTGAAPAASAGASVEVELAATAAPASVASENGGVAEAGAVPVLSSDGAAGSPSVPQPAPAVPTVMEPVTTQAEAAPSAAPTAAAGSSAAAPLTPGSALEISAAPQAGSEPVLPPVPATGGASQQMASAATSTTQALSQGERVRSFIKGYRGAGCVYARPDNVDAAHPALTGLGGSNGPVDDFLAAFRAQVGVEPEAALNLVMEPQCPAVDFIRAVVGEAAPGFDVILDQQTASDGGFLTGRLEGNLGGQIQLLLVDDAGRVFDRSIDFHDLGGSNFFGIRVRVLADGRGRNQLLLALVSARPLDIQPSADGREAAQLFQDIVRQAARQGASLRAAYAAFRVE